MGLTVLVVDRSAPLRPEQGNELIALRLFPLLGEHRRILVAPASADRAVDERDAHERLAPLFDAVHLVPRRRRVPSLAGTLEPAVARLLGPLGRLGPGVWPGDIEPDFPARFRAALHAVVARERVDVVHLRQLPMAAYRDAAGRLPRLLELVDAETLAARRATGTGLRARLRRAAAREIERRALTGVDVVTTVGEADALAIRRLRPELRVEIVPNGVDAAVFDPALPAARVEREPNLVVFVGAMAFPPNVAAARWFVAEALPRLRALRPGARFAIVGRDPAPAVRALAARPGVTVTGTVDDVRPWLARASVVVCPMVSGSGIKNKLLEALAMARPVVATSLAVEGLGLEPGRDLLVADGPEAMAASVARLLADPEAAAGLGRSGRSFVERHHTWTAAAARYDALWRSLAAGDAERDGRQ